MKIIFIVGSFLFTTMAFSADAYIAAGIDVSSYKVSDPDGDTSHKTTTTYLDILYVRQYARDRRFIAEASKGNVTLPGSVATIGQKVDMMQFNAEQQWQFVLAPYFRPWIGLGLGAQYDKFSDRYNEDSAGFLNQRFPDRNATLFNAFIDATHDITISDDFSVMLRARYSHPFGDGVSTTGIAAFLMYHYK